ncbi:PTS sugar transporter subunit IIA [Aquiluna sp. Uisw_065]|jgi:PTS system galactitol-specific IIA component|uniref:PTS sugar transporter subunit IIA n=1 Tax=Aquiluna sp. Uisw_065 TaxID=3230967 RepID=UPI0039E9C3C1
MSFNAQLIPNFFSSRMQVSTLEDALKGVANTAKSLDLVHNSWLEAVIGREKDFPTGLPMVIPVAIPHTESVHVKADGFGFFKLESPVDWGEMGSVDGTVSISMMFPLLITNPKNQVDLLMSVIDKIQASGFLESLMEAKTDKAIMEILGR